jgi:acetylornithine deacetylase/succinyl-diaminopimelate desuccinylase-like protein
MLTDAEYERLVEETLAICAVPAPTFHERARGELVAALLRDAGLEPSFDDAGNVVATVTPGPEPLVVEAHLDTVFGTPLPAAPRRAGDRLVGAGIGDNSLAVAMLLLLARRVRPERPFVVAATVGEEGEGDLRGAKALVAATSPRAFVALEGHGRDGIVTGGIGSVRVAATFTSPGGHSWADRGTASAIHGLVRSCAQLLDELPDRHVNIGLVEGGTSINTIAARATCKIDCRDEDPARLRETEQILFRVLADAHVEVIGRRPAGRTAPDHPLVELVRETRTAAGLPPGTEIASSTNANAALGAGVPAVSIGLTNGGGAHTVDEYVELEPLRAGADAALLLVERLS